ncbi:o-succinylbenzoate--CoA ligase [Rhodococcus tibetensis]|uniref:O-succinylbenzoate--CoA ligase n=1 Tax=Rhodococcus tibetensis TaxID=2965064 RepID=A0ABT1QHZ3_9NOCA|nr:o-succinylbenzoate--CoA ligase [Rhodococcus sp. FXJ9.536]MCQ4121913.1 o-succinylbenzoate--CoA ligase [Rhodococcus sp. FXJ9.536]
MNELTVLPVPPGAAALNVLPQLASILDGAAPAALPVPAFDQRETRRLTDALRPGDPIDDGIALVVATSGTTGVPKGAMLTAAALRASGEATHARLGGPGSWLLALPAHHIAGMQVLLRSVLAGTEPVVIDVTEGFDPAALPSAVEAMTSRRRYTSLVPTQLVKALDHPGAVAALACLDGVLLGGAATPASVLQRAQDSGITVVRTYGMSETCGGCVYDGVPLDGARVRIERDGRVLLGGPMLASGYRGIPDHLAFAEPGWFRTDDAGSLTDGILSITGRLDEAISTGGLTVVPQVVEAALNEHPAVRECAVFGLPDERLGRRVTAAVVAEPGTLPTLDELRQFVERTLDATAAPRELHLVDALPLRGPGKVDHRALESRFG